MNQPRDKFGRWVKSPKTQNTKVQVFQDNGFNLIPLGDFSLTEFYSFSKKKGGSYVTKTLT